MLFLNVNKLECFENKKLPKHLDLLKIQKDRHPFPWLQGAERLVAWLPGGSPAPTNLLPPWWGGVLELGV